MILYILPYTCKVAFPMTAGQITPNLVSKAPKQLKNIVSYYRNFLVVTPFSFCCRFADFVEGSFHLQDDELLSFDAGDSAELPPMTSDDDSDAEIDFRLSTR